MKQSEIRFAWPALVALLACACGDASAPSALAGGDEPSSLSTVSPSSAQASLVLSPLTIPAGCNPLAVTSDCMLPYPSDFLTVPDPSTPTGLRLALPAGALKVPVDVPVIDMTPYNRGDGAPTSAPILMHFGVDIDPSFLANENQAANSMAAGSPIALLDEATGQRVPFLSEMDANDPTNTARHALIIRPLTPLAFGSKYVVAISNVVRDVNGNALPPSPGFAALRDRIPTLEPSIEAARGHYEQVFSLLAASGYARANLLLAWDYTTASQQSVIGPIAAMRQRVFSAKTAKSGSIFVSGSNTITYNIDSVTSSTSVSGLRIVEGKFTPPNYLQVNNTIQYGADGLPVLSGAIVAPSYPFTMLVPSGAATQSAPLVVYGHGLFSDGRDDLTSSVALQTLAESTNSVFVATDWIGLSKSDEAPVATTVATDINNIGYVTDRLLQALVNNLSLVELSLGALSQDPQVRLSTAQPLLDPARVYYLGVSLGGIEGSAFISVARNVTRAVVGVPGASWSNILARSAAYGIIFQPIEKVVYPDTLLRQEILSLLQSRFDPADPINLATLFFNNPLPDSPPSRNVLAIESIDDCLVQNLTTQMLVRTFGIPEVIPFIPPQMYGVDAGTAPSSGVSQYQLQSDVAKYVPPVSNLAPTTDNGAHEGLAAVPIVLDEAQTFLTTGAIVESPSCNPGGCFLP